MAWMQRNRYMVHTYLLPREYDKAIFVANKQGLKVSKLIRNLLSKAYDEFVENENKLKEAANGDKIKHQNSY